MEGTEILEDFVILTIVNMNYPQELNGQGLMFYSRHEEAGGSDYDEQLIDYTEDDLILDDDGVPRILFSGEATSKIHYGTVHGAMNSARREIDRIISSWS